MRVWAVNASATAHGRIEVEAETEEEAVTKAHSIGGFEISQVDELLDFEVEERAEAL